MKKVLQYIFVLCILLGLTLSLAKAIVFPKDINYYENRYAVKLTAPTLSGWMDGSFQQNAENALTDQVPFAQTIKRLYHQMTSLYLKTLAMPVLKSNPDKYVSLGSNAVYNQDYIIYYPRELEHIAGQLDAKAADINAVTYAHPNTDFYLYYIEKDTDIHFETGTRLEAYTYLQNQLNLPEDHMGCLTIENFDQFSSYFYCTDHHWKAQGSLTGYRQILSMLKPDETALEPLAEVTLPGRFSGSKATGLLSSFSEDFTVFQFDFPSMAVTINGQSTEDYGHQDLFITGQAGPITYGNFYGQDDGEIIFDTGTLDRGNLLVIGESYDNAILKLLASHYDRTYSVDLRYYETYMGQEFNLTAYLEQHAIDTVLLVGNIDYYLMEEFFLGGQSDGIQ